MKPVYIKIEIQLHDQFLIRLHFIDTYILKIIESIENIHHLFTSDFKYSFDFSL